MNWQRLLVCLRYNEATNLGNLLVRVQADKLFHCHKPNVNTFEFDSTASGFVLSVND
jgi:hypothetical protein